MLMLCVCVRVLHVCVLVCLGKCVCACLYVCVCACAHVCHTCDVCKGRMYGIYYKQVCAHESMCVCKCVRVCVCECL